MAETLISPGVFERENDISFIQPAPVEVGAAIIGPTVKGPVEVPTVVTSYNDYTRKFGVTFESGSGVHEYFTSVAVKNYFQQGGNTCLVTRVVSGSYTSATSTNIHSTEAGTDEVLYTTVDALLNSVDSGFDITGSSAGTVTNVKSSDQNVTASFTLATSSSLSSVTVTGQGGTFSAGDNITFTSASLGATVGGGADLVISLVADDIATSTIPFTLKTIGKGAIYNNASSSTDQGATNTDGSLVSGSVDNIRWEVSNVDTNKGTFTLSIRRGDDSTNNKIILETFNNVNLDPNSNNYISKVVGNQYFSLSNDATQVEVNGDFVNNSNYVYVSAVHSNTINYLGNDGSIRIAAFANQLPSNQSGSFHSAAGTVKAGANLYSDINSSNTQGLVADNYSNVITLLGNKDDYRFNVISAPGIYNADYGTTVDSIVSLAETRGDCIAVVDLVAYNSSVSAVNTQAADLNSSYAAAYWPWLQTQTGAGKVSYLPPSVFIPGAYAFTDDSAAPWFAPAGLVRGGLTGVLQAEKKLTKSDRDSLYSNKVNPIATFPNTGLAIFGQKTLQSKSSALDRVNVRRLLIELKEFIGDQAKSLVFEQNTLTTRNRFLAAVNPYLTSVVQRQGLYGYNVVMDDTNNSADVIDRNQLVGQIFIQPTKTVEFIVLDFVVEPTGATFGE